MKEYGVEEHDHTTASQEHQEKVLGQERRLQFGEDSGQDHREQHQHGKANYITNSNRRSKEATMTSLIQYGLMRTSYLCPNPISQSSDESVSFNHSLHF